jgi:pyrimidine-nucleoside phosphorylase
MTIRAVDLIVKKRSVETLSRFEIQSLFDLYLKDEVADYQMSALLMAIFFNGMKDQELIDWTQAMMNSGEVLSFPHLNAPKVDKHSTGGVGDKISIPLAPLLAACGFYVPMMSGRGLGHTGGTLDKLESITGFNTRQAVDDFERLLRENKVAMIGQTETLVPADKRLYALRDVTGTVPSIPLIASSIMSKKLAEGMESLVLDVKVGKGAFMQTIDDARALAQACIALGQGMGKKVRAVITQMDQPLGEAIGNTLEILESIDILLGKGPTDCRQLVIDFAEALLEMNGLDKSLATQKLDDGSAYQYFIQMVKAQGGDVTLITHPEKFQRAKFKYEYKAKSTGYLSQAHALLIGEGCRCLGAGRAKTSDVINPAVGAFIYKKVGDFVNEGDCLMLVEHDEIGLADAIERFDLAFQIQTAKVEPLPLIFESLGD